MDGHTGKFVTALGAILVFAGHVAEAENFRDVEALRASLKDAVQSLPHYTGQFGKSESFGWRGGCERERTYFVDWSTYVSNVDADYDTKTHVTDMKLQFVNTLVSASGYMKDGIWDYFTFLCPWVGGQGTLDIGTVDINIRLLPRPEHDHPNLDLASIHFDNMFFTSIQIRTPLSSAKFGVSKVPNWLNQQIERSVNGIAARVIASGLRSRLDAYLTSELAKRLDDFRKSAIPMDAVPKP